MTHQTEHTAKSLRAILKHERAGLWLALLTVAAAAAADAWLNLQLMKLMDQAMLHQIDAVQSLIIQTMIIVCVSFVLEVIRLFVSARYFRRAMVGLRSGLLTRIFRLDLLSFNRRSSSLYYSNMTNDADTLETHDLEARFTVYANLIKVIAVFLILAYVNIVMLAIALGMMAVFAVVSQLLGKLLQKPQRERSGLLTDYTSYVREILSAFRLVKNNNLETRTCEEFDRRSAAVQRKGYEIDRVSTLIDGAMQMFMFGSLSGILLFVVWLSTQGLVTVGYILLVINSFSDLLQGITGTMEKLPMLKGVRSVWQTLAGNLNSLQTSQPETLEFGGLKQEVRAEHVSFAYEETPVLDDLDLCFEKGKKYLLIGPSGGGKSTVLRLLRKYISPDKGVIRIDGDDLEAIMTESYLGRLANVEQQVFLFDDTLRNNLTLYKSYSDAEILRAVHLAGLDDFIGKLPDGLAHPISDNGQNISGGEKARLAIARGLLQSADLLLLDEAFAGLDDAVARKIEAELLALKDVTVIQVSHVVFADTADRYDAVYTIAGQARS